MVWLHPGDRGGGQFEHEPERGLARGCAEERRRDRAQHWGVSVPTTKDLYAYGAPTIAAFTPASGITGSNITITGSGFAPGMVVRFGSLVSPGIKLLSGTQLRATVPNGDRPSAVTVSLGQGTATSTSEFVPTFSITGFSPRGGPAGTVVTVDGVGFNGSSVVDFNGVAAAMSFVSSTVLQATVPEAAMSGPVSVINTAVPVGTVKGPTGFSVAGMP